MPINLTDYFIANIQHALDDRENKADITARDAIPTIQRFLGLETFVVSGLGGGGEKYILLDGITNSDWVLVGSGIGGTAIPELVPYGSLITPGDLTANINFSRSNATGILNNTEGLNLGTNTTTVRYIDPAGSDANNGLTAGTPWLNRQYALDKMEAYLPGSYQIIAANGAYSENLQGAYNSLGRAANGGGTIVENVGDELVPANSIIAGSGNVYSNEFQGRGFRGTTIFAGSRFVGDSTGNAISESSNGLVIVRNCEFAQVGSCVDIQFGAKAFFDESTTGGTADLVGSLATAEDGGLIYIGASYTMTGVVEGLVGCGTFSEILFGDNLNFDVTGTGPGAHNFVRINSGDVSMGEQNTFIFRNGDVGVRMGDFGKFDGGQDNQFEFEDCDLVAELTDNSIFVTSRDGSGSYTTSGSTPSTANFSLDGQASVYNRLNGATGFREIPMAWFRAEALSATNFVLATDWRYTSPTISLPGTLPAGGGFFITPQGLSDTAAPLFVAKFPCIFSQFTIKLGVANGPNGITSVTDTFTAYLNGSLTTMAGVIMDGTEVTVTVNPIVCEVGDEVSIFGLFDANTLGQNISASI
jgi:hypothetical protein